MKSRSLTAITAFSLISGNALAQQSYTAIGKAMPTIAVPQAAAVTPAQPTPPVGQGLYDAKGAIVGQIISPGVVQRKIGSQWVSFNAQSNGFIQSTSLPPNAGGSSGGLLFTASNCAGTPYVWDAGVTAVPSIGFFIGNTAALVTSGTLYYLGPIASITFTSDLVSIMSLTPLAGSCQNINPLTVWAAPLLSTTIGPFTPPFVVK